MMRLLACEARKMMHTKALLLLVTTAVVLTATTMLSPVSGGPLFMTAGGDLNEVGAAIGFIGNQIDPQNAAGSAIRTAFLYTPLWLPLVIIFATSAFAADFTSRSIRVSKAKGISLTSLLVAKALTIFVCVGIAYLLSCLLSFLFKANQYGVTLEGADMALFFGILGTNILLLCALVAQCILLFSLFRNSLVSILALIVYHLYVLVSYPSSFAHGAMGSSENLTFLVSPAYYLLNTCSLSFGNVSIPLVIGYAVITIPIMLVASSASLQVREV